MVFLVRTGRSEDLWGMHKGGSTEEDRWYGKTIIATKRDRLRQGCADKNEIELFWTRSRRETMRPPGRINTKKKRALRWN